MSRRVLVVTVGAPRRSKVHCGKREKESELLSLRVTHSD